MNFFGCSALWQRNDKQNIGRRAGVGEERTGQSLERRLLGLVHKLMPPEIARHILIVPSAIDLVLACL